MAGIFSGGETLKYTAPTFSTILGLSLLSGCIQNPGPDKELKHGNNYSKIFAPYPTGYLEFTLRTELDKTHLEVHNAGKNKLDSADYLLQIKWGWHEYPFTSGFRDEGYEAMRHGRIRGLRPGESRKLGNVDLGSFLRTSDFRLAAEVLVSHQDGNRYGNPLAGFYKGTFRTTDSLAGSESGETYGFINADGQYVFWFSPHPKAFWQGFAVRPEYYMGHALSGKTGSAAHLHDEKPIETDSAIPLLPKNDFTLAEGELSASFLAQEPARTADGLELFLKPEEPE